MSPQHSSAGIPECRANVRRTVFAMPAPNYPAPAPPSARLPGQARIPRRYPQTVAFSRPLSIRGPPSSQAVGRRISVPAGCAAKAWQKEEVGLRGKLG
jgi:hypothetical protein